MTVGEWLHQCTPRPPGALVARIDAVLGKSLGEPSHRIPHVLLRAAEGLVTTLRASRSTSRDSALDLLTADALVTYAFEAASESPHDLEERASEAMRRIAALGADDPAR